MKVSRWSKKMHSLANAINTELRSDDNRFRMTVDIRHKDGSMLLLSHAFLMEHETTEKIAIFVFTEHMGFFIFDEQDIDSYCQYSNIVKIQAIEPN